MDNAEMDDELVTFRNYLYYFKLINAFSDKSKGFIFHYTSSNGLMGIIENHELWLTNTDFVNDKTECRALAEEKNFFEETDLSNKHVSNSYKRFRDRMSEEKISNTYIASFSRGKESLGQWRAYGNFRIAFDTKKLIEDPHLRSHTFTLELPYSPPPLFNLYQCVYKKEDIKKWIIEKSNIEEWKDCTPDDLKGGAASYLINTASRKYKNKHFENEKEVRLAVTSNYKWDCPYSPSMYNDEPPIYYRNDARYNFPVPYVKFIIPVKKAKEEWEKIIKDLKKAGEDLQKAQLETPNNDENAIKNLKKTQSKIVKELKKKKLEYERTMERELLPITEVMIGPMPHQEDAKLACEILLRDKGYENVPVILSDIPYRGF